MPKKLTKKDILRIIELHKDEIRSYGVKKMGVFGSYLKGKQKY
jgi:predicted nucleotidyltransferase